MDEQWRLFAAIEVPEPVRERLQREIDRLRQLGWRAKWVSTDGIHVTVKFYGSVSVSLLPLLREALSAGVAGIPPFTLEVAGAGVFPHPRRPRVLWVGIAGEDETLARLQRQVEEWSARVGFPLEERPFHPHLTLARFRPEDSPPQHQVQRALEQLSTLPRLPIPVRALTLYRSELRRTGAVYSVVDTVPLEAAR